MGQFTPSGEIFSSTTLAGAVGPSGSAALSVGAIEKHYEVLDTIGSLRPEVSDGLAVQKNYGFSRRAWSAVETKAMEYFERLGRGLGLQARYDGVGNLYLRTRWGCDKVVQVGSHVDTVKAGGNFDGVAGVIAGFEAIRAIIESRDVLAKGLELVVWRGEESAFFGKPYLGSLAAFGLLDSSELRRVCDAEGISLGQAIDSQPGCNSHCIRAGRSALSPEEINAIDAYLELHIEQGTVLEHHNIPIGIVSSIRGSVRTQLSLVALDGGGLNGRTQAQIIKELSEYTEQCNSKGIDLVTTFFKVNTDCAPNGSALKECGPSSIAGYAELGIQGGVSHSAVRSVLDGVTERHGVRCEIDDTQEHLRVRFFGRFDHSGATPMGVREYRQDANRAAAEALLQIAESDGQATYTLNYPAHPQRAEIFFDTRGRDSASRDQAIAEMIEIANRVVEANGVRMIPTRISTSDPVEQLSPRVQDMFERHCGELGVASRRMPSGAGHDVAVVSNVIKPDGTFIETGLLFIPCKDGLSHNPDESAKFEDISSGAKILERALRELAA